MSKSYFILLLSILILTSCGQKKKEEQLAEEAQLDSVMNEKPDTLQLFEENREIPKTVDELFDDFFFTFATDSKFQKQRIHFPIHFKDGNAEMKLSKSDWKNYNRFDQQEFFSVIFEREKDLELQKDTTIHKVSVEWIYLQDGYVEKYNFNRVPEGQWVLSDIEKQDIENMNNGGFVKFFSQFVNDSTFQRSCLKEPIHLHMRPQGEDPASDSEVSADDWFEMKGDLPIPNDVLVTIDYGQKNSGSNKKNLLMEGASNGLFMEFKFEKTADNWKLYGIEY